MFTYILLDCLDRMNGERTVSGVFHLLRGKKSSQTFQDAKVYGIDRYYGIYRELNRNILEEALYRLEEERAIEWIDEAKIIVTSSGKERIEKDRFSFHFSGMDYSEAIDEFQNRFMLWVQIVSNGIYNQKSYIPVVDKVPIQQWLKSLYMTRKSSLTQEAEGLYLELHKLLSVFSEKEKMMFVRRLTGGDQTGWTYNQLAEAGEDSVYNIPLYLKNIYYYLFFAASENPSSYLYELTRNLGKKETLTSSSRKSVHLYDKVNSIEEVARIRNLKTSTIEDHLVEAVLVNNDRSIHSFISPAGIIEIEEVVHRTNTKRLKVIREYLDDKYSYFQIRIVLAKIQKG
ncbi:helix-turn-helix domain-containing protein [Salimicrobium flavidum]|uniref:Uncharacterized protein YpbB n=1 Tax=Salimicrobium flavidum TaxID=570947 RepID=A0A1N7IJ44_9BACI|nr:helix-turn-helix domain-containing protein [Salimicrobium flavidum]SIS37070.1 Uncharacterized protein YpbB [Salimicrobium flavidum]